ncbi:MAG: D-alanine--D-alanine ligase family protein [Actinomycetota bacterium]
MSRKRVGVIFGGRSVEHDVSVVTGHQAMEVLVADHDVVPIYVTREGEWFAGEALNDLDVYRKKSWADVGERAFLPPVAGTGGLLVPGGRLKGSRVVSLDVVVPAIHGTFGEDGTLQGVLELADIPYTGSGVAGSAVGMDKVAMKALFQAAGLPVLPHVVVDGHRLDRDRGPAIAEIEAQIPYPVFVKPSRLGSSVGIGKARDRDALEEVLEVARRYDTRIIAEQAVEDCSEVNCSVLGGHGRELRASVCEQPIPWEEFLSFFDKYMRGGKGKADAGMVAQERRIPAPISDTLTKTVQANALTAFEAIDAAGVARIDSFVREDTGETWVMEINTMPGSFSFYLWEASGVTFRALMANLIDIALEGHAAKSELMFSFESGMLERSKGLKSGG